MYSKECVWKFLIESGKLVDLESFTVGPKDAVGPGFKDCSIILILPYGSYCFYLNHVKYFRGDLDPLDTQ